MLPAGIVRPPDGLYFFSSRAAGLRRRNRLGPKRIDGSDREPGPSPLGSMPHIMTMHAAVLPAPGRVEVREVALPQPDRGQVRIRLEGCGVCASNLGPWAGPDWMRFPTEPGALGHEGWGVIDALGEG